MASYRMTTAEIAELLTEAAEARRLAETVNDSIASGDLLNYAFALEACASGKPFVAPVQGNWISQRPRRQARN